MPAFPREAGTSAFWGWNNSFQKNGTVYHHLLDPRTGYPMPLTLKSVSILSSRPVYTDLLSTAFFILGEEEGGVLVDRLRRDSGEMIEYVAVREDGTCGRVSGRGRSPCLIDLDAKAIPLSAHTEGDRFVLLVPGRRIWRAAQIFSNCVTSETNSVAPPTVTSVG